jgi:hypothetical protein
VIARAEKACFGSVRGSGVESPASGCIWRPPAWVMSLRGEPDVGGGGAQHPPKTGTLRYSMATQLLEQSQGIPNIQALWVHQDEQLIYSNRLNVAPHR